MFQAISGMLLDVLAAVARKDYDDRRRRQAQGQARAKAAGFYKGRQENNDGIAAMLRAGSPAAVALRWRGSRSGPGQRGAIDATHHSPSDLRPRAN